PPIIVVRDLASGRLTRVTLSPPTERHTGVWMEWISERRLAFQINWGDIYAIGSDGSKLSTLFESRTGQLPRVVALPEDDPKHIVVRSYEVTRALDDYEWVERLYSVDVGSGRRTLVYSDETGYAQFAIDHAGAPRAGVLFRDGAVEIRYRDPKREAWRSIDALAADPFGTRAKRTGPQF